MKLNVKVSSYKKFYFQEKMQKLVTKYENRMRDFVLKMAEKPVMIKKSKDKFSTSRQEFFALTSNKILDKKGFQFKSYKSDKERINEFLKGKESLDKYLEEIAKEKKRKEKLKKKKNIPKLVQPSMRFTARTDFERVYDILKNRNALYEEEKVIKNQLAKMGFTSHIEDEDEEDEESDKIEENEDDLRKKENLTDEEIMQKERHKKIIQQRKNMINKRKFLLNIDNKRKIDYSKMKYLRGDLYPKTYFKTMENLTMFRTSTIDHNAFKKWKKDDEKKQKNIKINSLNKYNNNILTGLNSLYDTYFPKVNKAKDFRKLSNLDEKKKNNVIINYNDLINMNIININNNDNNNSFNKGTKFLNNNQQKQFNLVGNKKILEELEITKDIANINPLLFNLNFNNVKNDNTISPKVDNQLSMLKKMAFEKNENYTEEDFNRNLFTKNDFEDYKKEDNIIIDGKEYKKSETYKIADRVLKKCNYNENKVKYNSNEGGLMFTNGLSINEFEAKYGF